MVCSAGGCCFDYCPEAEESLCQLQMGPWLETSCFEFPGPSSVQNLVL